ncbi:MAG: HlyD family efflux transporter periplasmic adaptor subunit [Anaerolineae bacterium]
MNTLTRGLLVAVLFIITGAAAACSRGGDTAPAAQATPAPAKASGKIVAEGSVVPVRYSRLGFSAAGTVATLNVQQGDKVKKDGVIAKLDTTDFETAVQKAQAGVKTAEANLAKIKAGPRTEDVAAAESKVGVAEAGVKAAEGRLSAAQGQASEAQAGITSAQGGLQASQAAFDKVKAGATDEDIAIAQRKVEQAKNQAWGYQAQRDAVCGRSTGPKEFRTTDQAQCDQAQAQVQANDENIRLAELALQQLQNGAREEDVRSAQAAVTQGQGSVGSAQARARTAQGNVQAAQGDVANAQANLESAKAELERVKVPARPEDIAVAEAQLNEAKVALATAQADLDKASLKAPFDGIITNLDVKQGERVQPNTPLITIADTSKWQIDTTDLTELNVVRLKVGDPVTITFDALPDVTLPGTITRISDQGENKQGDIVYTVTVTPNQWDDRLRWKMTASVNFEPSK